MTSNGGTRDRALRLPRQHNTKREAFYKALTLSKETPWA